MAQVDSGIVTLEDLVASSLGIADVLVKLLIDKGLITEAEFMELLRSEKVYKLIYS